MFLEAIKSLITQVVVTIEYYLIDFNAPIDVIIKALLLLSIIKSIPGIVGINNC